MPLVFVHGVNVRNDKCYLRETTQRNEHFARILFPLLGREIHPQDIFNPFWGDLGTSSGTPFIPPDPQWMIVKLTQRLTSGNGSLLRLARHRPLKEVFDVMVAASIESDEGGDACEDVSGLGLSLIELSSRFASVEAQNEWLKDVQTDSEFLSKVQAELESTGKRSSLKSRQIDQLRRSAVWLRQRYSMRREQTKTGLQKVRERLRRDADRLRQRTRAHMKAVAAVTRTAASEVSATALTQPIRKRFHDRMFYFIGDAFSYFGQRGTPDAPGAVIMRISDALTEARLRRTSADDELIVIAHSMGGNIVCDIASYFEKDRAIDLVITVGSQFPLFADLQMFPGFGREKPFRKPECVKRWINIYDLNDFFAFAAQPLFEGIEDHHYASGRIGTTTHADCFKFISLYEHMAQSISRGSNG